MPPVPSNPLYDTQGGAYFKQADQADKELSAKRAGLLAEEQRQQGEATAEHAKDEASAAKDLSALQGQEPVMPDFKQVHKDMTDFTGLMLFMAALGGMVTRTPLTSSLNNLNAAMQGFMKGDQQSFENSYKAYEEDYKKFSTLHTQWKDKFDTIKEQIKAGKDSYKDNLAAIRLHFGYEEKALEAADKEAKRFIDEGNAMNNAAEKAAALKARVQEHKDNLALHRDALVERRHNDEGKLRQGDEKRSAAHEKAMRDAFLKEKMLLDKRRGMPKQKGGIDEITYSKLLNNLKTSYGQGAGTPAGQSAGKAVDFNSLP